MEQDGGGTPFHFIGTRRPDLEKSFMVAVRSLLTSCSREEFKKAFPNFTNAEQQRLHHLFIQDEFESLCLEAQVGKILDTVQQHVEEQSLDLLFSDKECHTEIFNGKGHRDPFLRAILEKAEEKMLLVQACIDQLKKGTEEVLGSTDVVDKLRGSISSYQT